MAPAENFHDGELAVQRLAGVQREAGRLAGMLGEPHLDGGIRSFLADRDLAVITARDADHRLWTSPLRGAPGFLQAHDGAADRGGGTPSGRSAVGPAGRSARRPHRHRVRHPAPDARQRHPGARRARPGSRSRWNRLTATAPSTFSSAPLRLPNRCRPAQSVRRDRLSAEDGALIARADTFFLGTVHPHRGADASHRGGTPGFVRVDGSQLWWPDYPGNNMFNSLGNLAVDDSARTAVRRLRRGPSAAVVRNGSRRVDGPGGPPATTAAPAVGCGCAPEVVVASDLGLRAQPPVASPYNPAVA